MPSQDRYPWKVLGIVILGTFMAALDQSIVNVSLPAMMADFNVRLTQIEWVVTAYMLAFATFMPVTTWLRDRMGHKRLFLLSLVTFTLGSLFCGIAWSNNALIAARVLQAFGGGAMTPIAMTMLTEVFPQERRGRALGYWAMGVVIGPTIGPTLGGFLTAHVGWRSIFLVNLPIGILGIVLGAIVLKPDRPAHTEHHTRKPFDLWGFVSLTLFLLGFLLALARADHFGWGSPYIVICFAASALGLVSFLLIEKYNKIGAQHGIIDLRLFKSGVFTACILVTLIRSFALFGGVFLLPLFLQQVMKMDEVQTGLLLLPGSLLQALLMPVTGRLTDRVGPRCLATLGVSCVTAFMALYYDASAATTVFWLLIPTFLRGIGVSLLFTPVMVSAINSTPKQKANMTSAMIHLSQQIGGSLGIALLAAVVAHRQKHLMGKGWSLDAATVEGFDLAFLIGAAVVAFGIIAALALPKKPVRNQLETQATHSPE